MIFKYFPSIINQIYFVLATLREEKAHWTFVQELKSINEGNIRPVPPSKIPVGKQRDRDNSIPNCDKLGDEMDINRNSRSASPSPTSKIPVGGWRNRTTAYKNLMERQEKDGVLKDSEKLRRNYFKPDSLNLINRHQNSRPNIDSESYGHWDNYNSKRSKVPSITLNDGDAYRFQSECNYSNFKARPTDSKKQSKLIRQRSRSAGPSRTMQLSPIGQI